MRKLTNLHVGQTFHDFLREEGIYELVQTTAIKRVLSMQLEDAMKDLKLGKSEMARRMEISRPQLERLLDLDNGGVTLDTLIRAAAVVGRKLRVELI